MLTASVEVIFTVPGAQDIGLNLSHISESELVSFYGNVACLIGDTCRRANNPAS
jgi:hypothetical protein